MKRQLIYIAIMSLGLLYPKERNVLLNTNTEVTSELTNRSTELIHGENPNSQNREEIELFNIDFEGDVSGWSAGNSGGWELTETDYNSATHSYNSPDANDSGEFAGYDLFSQELDLPLLGEGEIMQFKFALNCDMPDYTQEDDPATPDDESGFLADYYGISIMDPTALAWHPSTFSPTDGNNWWCGDEEIGGYLDSWVQYLDTPEVTIGTGASLSADMKWALEDPAGAIVAGTCTDGWDQANVQISTDGGDNWMVIVGSDAYDFECGYGTVYNGFDGAPGWGGIENWHNVSFDLSAYAGQTAQFRFAFYSDPAYSTIDDGSITGFQVDNIVVSGGAFTDTADDPDALAVSGEVWIDQLYDYCDETQPGSTGWTEYLPGYPFNGNIYLDISDFAGKTVVFRFQTRYDGDFYSEAQLGGQGTGLWIDDLIIYKESSGSYPAPQNLMGEAWDSQVNLSWDDMNAAGTDNYVYDNDQVTNSIQMSEEGSTAWAGAEMNIAGESTVNSVSIYNVNAAGTSITIAGFGTLGSLYSNEPSYTADVVLTETGWNAFDVSWSFNNNYIVAHQFSFDILVGLDESAVPSSHSMILFAGGGWDLWSVAGATVGDGEWGIRANVTTVGANVTYNVYRDGSQIASGFNTAAYSDNGVENNVTYEYQVSATYPDGEESGNSNEVNATPQSQTVHEMAYDDGTYESTFNAGSANYCAVNYTANANGEDVVRFKWYQTEDGGAFYLRLWADENGLPGTQIHSVIVASGLLAGWNEKDLSEEGLVVSGDFWVGVKEFSTSKPFGVDNDSNQGASLSSTDDWTTGSDIGGNLMFRIFLDEGDGGGTGDCTADDFGDATGDGDVNVLDIVTIVNFIMGNDDPDVYESCASDVNEDGTVNVLDIVSIVNMIMGN